LPRPRDWQANFIRRFVITLGQVRSVFDFITFFILLVIVQASEATFRTGWFIESIATQVLVIFVLRSRGNPWRSCPNPWLAGIAIAVVAVAVLLPFKPLAGLHGFVAPPTGFLLLIAVLVVDYRTSAEAAKRWFYRTRRRARSARH